ncbi:apolipoprotein N-acyltransferase [Pseudonocardia sp. KRD-184]|uniref:Apolipoprotein N-acyltransferase n=2 Tax=Pseudonocardia oceani TaxID=2792013 RepID=A0ABS6U2Y5_9PSEU|nr:apolipoprotein N-acyltransferase [Pseudonocardia oceani]MBW0097942.1 apolipoprotein N-acyltransferase [Pseudonocardia oceani]MBW0120932.1 apolipoprotein N-acyltransferase [Pseudonocardia oceani]MBW0126526.1 apolipoprotein N-acyltransferase [Pseudonocardia oceani]
MLPLGVAALTVALHGRGLRARLWLGGLAGVVLYGTTLGWLTGFAAAGYVAIAALEAVMLAAAVGLVPTARSGRWAGGWWALPAGLVLLDAAQTRFPFSGFPLPALVHAQLDGPFVFAAPLGGSLLVTAVAATAGVGLAALVLTSGQARLIAVGVAVAVAGAPVAVGAAVATADAGSLDVAVVQGGGPRGLRAVFTDPQDTTDRQFAVAEQITGSPDLVLFAETVISVDGSITGSAADVRTAELARRLDAPVVVGVVENQGTGFRNAAVLWGHDGTILGRYEKEHRVPFGEYIPGRELLSRVTDLTALVPRDAIAGEGTAVLEPPAGPLGVVISYEVLFADRVREAVTAGGRIVLVPTNAASYVTEDVPAIEVAGARLRALEYGRTVLQAAPTGYSVVVAPDGRVLAQSGLGGPALLRETVPLRTGLTPYARTGDGPMLVLAALALLLPVLLRRRAAR